MSPSARVIINIHPLDISMRSRRLARSIRMPTAGNMLTDATDCTILRDPSRVPEPVISYTSQLTVTCWIHMPAFERTVPVNR